MQKKIVVNKGKKYIVNVVGGDEGIGAGCPSGTAWLQDQLGAWYSVQLTGLSGSLSFSITAIPAANQSVGMNSNDFGFQIVQADDTYNYQVSIDSTGPSVVITQIPSGYESSKPFLFLQSVTDSAYYYVTAQNIATVITLVINDNSRIAGSLVQPLN
jgi:hypothetical protein